MPEKPNEGAADQAGQPQAAKEPSEIVLRAQGKDVSMPIAKVKTLAQQGLNQQRVQEQITADRAALESDAQSYKEYQNLRAHLEANPDVQRAVTQAINDPASVLNPQSRQADDDFGGDGSQQQPQASPGSSREMADLRRQVAQLESQSKKRDERDATTHQASAIDREVSEYPWLEKDGLARSMAKSQIAAQMATTPGADLASTTAVVAQNMRELLEEERTAKANAEPGRRRLRNEPPGRGTPPVRTDKPMTKKSFKDGSMLKAMMGMARDHGFNVD